MKPFVVLGTIAALVAPALMATAASGAGSLLRAAPPQVQFGTRDVGTFTLQGTKITNTGPAPVLLLVTGEQMPDDFSFGLLEGSTCPVLEPALLAPGESCDAVVGFRPAGLFAGARQLARLRATAKDPQTGLVVETLLIDFHARGRLATK